MGANAVFKTALQIGGLIFPELNVGIAAYQAIVEALKANGATIPDDIPVAEHQMNGKAIVINDEELALSAAWRAAHPAPKPQ